MKRRFTLLIAIIFVAFIGAPILAMAAFSDVPTTHPDASAIASLQETHIVSGYADKTFKPDQEVSRAEAVAIILKAAGISVEQSSAKIPFTDVPSDAWFLPMVQTGVAIGKIKGYEDETFRPYHSVTLPEALSFLTSFFNISTKKVPIDEVMYDGLGRHEWYSGRLQYAKNNNLIEPDASGRINPSATLTRGQFAQLVYRMIEVKRSSTAYDITKKWTITEHAENFWKIKHPAEWELFKGLKNTVIWKRVEPQVFFSRLWPESVRFSISLVENISQQTASQYFEKLRQAYEKNYHGAKRTVTEILLNGRRTLKVAVPKERLIEATIELPNKKYLVLSGEYGRAPIGVWHAKQLEAIISSYQFIEKPIEPPKPVVPLSERMSQLREKILVSGAWKDIAPLFPDKKLTHTDAIGIGTGPVDYHFSKEANHTIKVERSSSTILNIREAETSAF